MATYYYYVNAFDNTYLDWLEYGASPYLDTINYPTAYIRSGYGFSGYEGIWDFPNSGAERSENLDRVFLEFYMSESYDVDLGYAGLVAYVWDGVSWASFSIFGNETWAWRSVEVTSHVNSWAKLDACRVYVFTTTSGSQDVFVDCCRLRAETSIPVVAKRLVMDGLTVIVV